LAPYICGITLSFILNNNIIAPPFTSKISKIIFIELLKNQSLITDRYAYKPVTISPVMSNGKPIFKLNEKNQDLIKLEAEKPYEFHVSIIEKEPSKPLLLSLIESCGQTVVNVLNAKAEIIRMNITLKQLEELHLPNSNAYRVEFKTPTILQMPKSLRWRFKGPRYVLFPHPYLMIWSLATHWNAYAPPSLRIHDVWKLAYYATHALMEVDYNIKPVTAIYTKGKGPRGFIGWVLYKFRGVSKRLNEQILRLLEYANYMGIGKSRSIGFGMVEAKPINSKNRDNWH